MDNNLGHEIKRQQQQPEAIIHTSSIDTVVRYLNTLAHMPASQLWKVLGMEDEHNHGDDPFSLRELENGKCPWSSTEVVDWLPPRPYNSESIAKLYRDNMKALKKRGTREPPAYDAENEVAIWYEHLSKAGGTTFCGLAVSNMIRSSVPRYHCMPRKGELMDGRVGSWPNEELVDYLLENRYAIVSNEWDPFNLEKLILSGRHLNGKAVKKNIHPIGPKLLFLTTLRDPSDRLLSAYTFFGLTVGMKNKKSNDVAPSFSHWMTQRLRSTGNFVVGSKRLMRANIARYNHIVWRFSGGELTHHVHPLESEWETPFETAIQALSQHDLILPMDVMTKDGLGKTALLQLLGWNSAYVKGRGGQGGNKKEGQIVTTGGIKNSNAREYFSEDEYRKLWEDNWLDNILYLWCRAVFLARLQCKDVIL